MTSEGGVEKTDDDRPGNKLHAKDPAISGHNNYFLWGPPDVHGPIIGVGYVKNVMDLVCPGYVTVASISNPYGVVNEEAGLPLYLRLEPDAQLSGVWESVKHYN